MRVCSVPPSTGVPKVLGKLEAAFTGWNFWLSNVE